MYCVLHKNLHKITIQISYIGVLFLQYVGKIVSSTISPAKAIEISNEIARKGPKMNKRRVSLILTPESKTAT